jgi:hypothetical protein
VQGKSFNTDVHANVGRRLAGENSSSSSGDLESEQSPLQSKRSSMLQNDKKIDKNYLLSMYFHKIIYYPHLSFIKYS